MAARPLRIGIDARALSTPQRFRGIGAACRAMLSALSAQDHENHYVLFLYDLDEPALPPLHPAFRHEQVTLGPPPTRLRQLHFLTDKLRIPWLTWRWRLDLLHILAPFELLYGFHIWPGMPPVVVTAWDIIPWHRPEENFGAQVKTLRRLYAHHAHLLRSAAHVSCISQTTRRDLEETFGIDARKSSTNVLGVDDELLTQPAASGALPAGITPPYLLHVGGDSPHKNIALLIDAAHLLRERGHPIPLVLAGPYNTSALETPIAEYRARHGTDALHVTGFLPRADLLTLYRGATAFAFPSTIEGFGLPPLEAMACGVPVVISSAPSLVELFGDAALVADPLDAPTLATQLQRLLEDPALRERCRRDGLSTAARFTWGETARRTLAMYRHATEHKT